METKDPRTFSRLSIRLGSRAISLSAMTAHTGMRTMRLSASQTLDLVQTNAGETEFEQLAVTSKHSGHSNLVMRNKALQVAWKSILKFRKEQLKTYRGSGA
eukprot:817649-Pelagomonas_calceolata.AAC.2